VNEEKRERLGPGISEKVFEKSLDWTKEPWDFFSAERWP
jgi:hypothetical protein